MEDERLFKKEQIDEVKKKHEKRVIEQSELRKEDQEIFEEMLKEAKMPVEMTDEKFVLGESELDIRNLSAKNYKQMMFRSQVLENVYLRQIVQSMTDIMRLQMVLLRKNGVIDINKELEELDNDLRKLMN